MSQKLPQHAIEVRISIGGHTWDHIKGTLRELLTEIQGCGEIDPQCSGGYSGSYAVTVAEREISREQYHRELEAWNEHEDRNRTPADAEVEG